MLEQLENWKWRVEIAASGAAVLVTSSQCPHGLGLLPSTLDWQGGGFWRTWPGTFEFAVGALVHASSTKWRVLDGARACQGSAGIKQLGSELVGLPSLQACQAKCADRSGCRAIDYYSATQYCLLYDTPCAVPEKTHDGASSYTMHLEASIASRLGVSSGGGGAGVPEDVRCPIRGA